MLKNNKVSDQKSAEDLRKIIDVKKLPVHAAVIMDGNGRWAQARKLPRVFGHRQGAKSVRKVVESARELGIKVLTLYAFSSENWKRPREEVSALMNLLKVYIKKELSNLNKNNIKFMTIGDTDDLDQSVKDGLSNAIKKTASNDGMTLVVALNYGSRQEIIRAVNKIVIQKEAGLDEKRFSDYLDTAGLPDPDLLIRTSGEMRISNFLLWQCAYSEFVVTDVLWPDFGKRDFYKAVIEFQSRQRRFGGL